VAEYWALTQGEIAQIKLADMNVLKEMFKTVSWNHRKYGNKQNGMQMADNKMLYGYAEKLKTQMSKTNGGDQTHGSYKDFVTLQ
jgi:hypothetical protein